MTKQLTLRQIPEDVEQELRREAARNDTSLNRTAIAALRRGLGLPPPVRRRRDVSELAGKWTNAQAEDFEARLQIFENVDEERWSGMFCSGVPGV